MFKITNNNIFISRGETAVYDSCIVTKRGAPLVLTTNDNIENYYIEFVVRRNTETRENDIFRYFLSITGNNPDLDIHLFDSIDIIEYDGYIDETGEWTESPQSKYNNCLHYYFNDDTEKTTYKRWNGEDWVDYKFRIMFPFPYKAINALKADTYVYEINLLGGGNNSLKTPPININFKKTLLIPHEFKVGGSIGE